MEDNPIAFVNENAFENLPRMESLGFDMYYSGCDNIPFWRWLKLNQTFSTSVICSDYDGEKLSSLQANNVTDCFKCMVGYYGYKCNISCDGCLSDSRDSEYGICTDVSGCKPGWQPRQPKCDLACVDGTYGQDCRQNCSNSCYNNTCHVVSGLCLSGCRKGWMGPYCKQPCVYGTHGQNSKQNCSDNCYNNTCNVVSGFCVSGCIKGWMGQYCQQITPKPADNYIAVFIVVGAFLVTTLVAVIVFATPRYRKRKDNTRGRL